MTQKLAVTFTDKESISGYQIEVFLVNLSDAEFNHFRLILLCCVPQDISKFYYVPDDISKSVEIIYCPGVPGLAIEPDLNDFMVQLLPSDCPQGYKLVHGWQGRTSRIHIYPYDHLRVATIMTFSDLYIQWRLDSGDGVQKGDQLFTRH